MTFPAAEQFDLIQERLRYPPTRVVSLVPSLTESLFDLGLGASLVGITDYCVRPAKQVAALPRVGGTKNPRPADVLGLTPDLVLANWEENTRGVIGALEASGIPVWVTFPQTVTDALSVLRQVSELWQAPDALVAAETLERSVEWQRAALADEPGTRYFCPIWMDETESGETWWMTSNHETYVHDLLELMGGTNVFAHRQRRYPLEADLGRRPPEDPGERDTRYPRVSAAEIQEADPALILLPDEPYAFGAPDVTWLTEAFPELSAVRQGRVLSVDGSLLTWHGTRLARALQQLPGLLAASAGSPG
jgi:ABC-type Fe3+-hydroxamate transport system substrate-binding protein